MFDVRSGATNFALPVSAQCNEVTLSFSNGSSAIYYPYQATTCQYSSSNEQKFSATFDDATPLGKAFLLFQCSETVYCMTMNITATEGNGTSRTSVTARCDTDGKNASSSLSQTRDSSYAVSSTSIIGSDMLSSTLRSSVIPKGSVSLTSPATLSSGPTSLLSAEKSYPTHQSSNGSGKSPGSIASANPNGLSGILSGTQTIQSSSSSGVKGNTSGTFAAQSVSRSQDSVSQMTSTTSPATGLMDTSSPIMTGLTSPGTISAASESDTATAQSSPFTTQTGLSEDLTNSASPSLSSQHTASPGTQGGMAQSLSPVDMSTCACHQTQS